MNETSAINPPYKLLKIYRGPSESFVYFHYYSKLKKKYIRMKFPPHLRGATPAQVDRQLNDIYRRLETLINFRNRNNIYHEEVKGAKKNVDVTLTEVAQAELLRKDLPENRKMLYRAFISQLDGFYQNNKYWKDTRAIDCNEPLVKDFVTYLKSKNLAGKTINNHLWVLHKLSETLVKQKLITSPVAIAEYYVAAPKNQTERFKPLNIDEARNAFNYFKSYKDGRYYLFLLIIHYTCIRPIEIHRLQAKFFNFTDRTIYIPWFNSKNGLSNYVQILDPLFEALLKFGIDKMDPDLFLFDGEFKASTEMYQGDNSSDVWKKSRNKAGIPQDKQQYALKHTFNTMYVNNNKKNIDWEWLRRHNRHATVQQTQDYISQLTAYFLDQQQHVIVDFT